MQKTSWNLEKQKQKKKKEKEKRKKKKTKNRSKYGARDVCHSLCRRIIA